MIDTTKPYADILTAVALGDPVTTARLTSELTENDHRGLFIYATAVMSICLGQRFEHDFSREAIAAFAEELRRSFAESSISIDPAVVESIIRAFAGEQHLLDEVSIQDQIDLQYPIIRKIVAESDPLREQLDVLTSEAFVLLREWESTEGGL